MAISPEDLLELALLKFDLRYASAQPLPRDVHIPGRGVWKSTATNDTGEVQTLLVRLGSSLLEVKNYPVAYPHVFRPNLGDIWLFDVSAPPRQELELHLSSRVGSGIEVGLTPTGRACPEAIIPKGLMKFIEKVLIAI